MVRASCWPFVFALSVVLLAACTVSETRPASTATPMASGLQLVIPSLLPTISPTNTPSPTPTPHPAAIPISTPHFQLADHTLRSRRIIVNEGALWASHIASRTVTRLGLPDGLLVWQTEIGCDPVNLARIESRLLVTCFDSGELVTLSDESGEILARTQIGHGAYGLLIAADRIYVTLAHEESMLALRADTLTEIARTPTGRQPRGLALKKDRLYVVHLLDASLRVYDAQTLAPLGAIQIGLQAALAETVTIHPSWTRAYVPHQRQHTTNMARLFDNTVFPVVSALDTEQLRPVRREALALDSVDSPVSMPIAVALNLDGTRLYTANAVSDDLSVVDLAQGLGVGHVVVGHHPRDLALSPDGKRLYTLNLVSDDVSVVDTDTLTVVDTLTLAHDPRPAIIQQGERIFSTSRPDKIARDNWIACASCHFSGGSDGQIWFGANDGARNTPILRGISDTEPLHWSADRPNVQSFQETFTGLMKGMGLSQSELDALAAYLNSLQPFTSPLREPDSSLPLAAIEGAAVFQRAGCAVCHTLPLFTDQQMHDVGTGEAFHDNPDSESQKIIEAMGPAFDTPSLRELWLTAPYLHDGRATTLRDVLTTFNATNQHGQTSNLSEGDVAALEAFLLMLPLSAQEQAGLFGE